MSFKALTVRDQNADNFLKIQEADSPCCGDSATMCEYTTTYTAANTVSGITITEDGASRALTFSAVSGAANVKAAIIAALADAGYENADDGIEAIEITGSTTFTVVCYSDVPLVSLAASGGTATFTAKCTSVDLCTFAKTISATAASNSVSINGKNTAIIDITYGTTAGSAILTSVNSAITTSGESNVTAAITPTGTTGPYTLTFTAPFNTTIKVNLAGTYDVLDRANCAIDWV